MGGGVAAAAKREAAGELAGTLPEVLGSWAMARPPPAICESCNSGRSKQCWARSAGPIWGGDLEDQILGGVSMVGTFFFKRLVFLDRREYC